MTTVILICAGCLVATCTLQVLFFLLIFSRFRKSISTQVQQLSLQKDSVDNSINALRSDLIKGLATSSETISKTLTTIGELQKSQNISIGQEIKFFTEHNRNASEALRSVVEQQLKSIYEFNEKKLDDIRKTVDDKLNDTLEKRLGQSFNLVSTRLESVQKGLGEMQNLAAGVGDLKKVLTNVKTRGIWGEIQLGAILEQILTPEQFSKNVKTKPDSSENVEFAIKLPGKEINNAVNYIWLPVDSKFPLEDYQRVLEYSDSNDPEKLQTATSNLISSVKKMAKDIRDKYVAPPFTTDFGILFLPVEGLYAETLRHPGLIEDLQQNYRIIIAGPTTFSALLNSLKVGFRTLAIEKRASEVWQTLAAVKQEFRRFGEVLDRVKKQLGQATRSIDDTGVRTRVMEKKLIEVEQLPAEQDSFSFRFPESQTMPQDEELEQKTTD